MSAVTRQHTMTTFMHTVPAAASKTIIYSKLVLNIATRNQPPTTNHATGHRRDEESATNCNTELMISMDFVFDRISIITLTKIIEDKKLTCL